MPSPAFDPAAASIEETLAKLSADQVNGLSLKEAERRRAASLASPLYANAAPRPRALLARAFREPVLWLQLAVSVIVLCFDRVFLGLVCLALAGGHAALSAWLGIRGARIDAAMQASDAPLCRVLRGRRIIRVGVAGIVKGDILLFYPGDMIPADCRLLRTHGFSVSEQALAAGEERQTRILQKDADAVPDAAVSHYSPVNMVYAGGVVEAGSALAVVTAVGSETHLGALIGTVRPAHAGRVPTPAKTAAKRLSLYNLLLVFLIVPVIALGIITLGDRYNFLDIFLSALSLISLTLTEHLMLKAAYVCAVLRRDAATERDESATADIKSAFDIEKLTRMTDLFLVGAAALHDGSAHPLTLHVGDRSYRCDHPEADETAAEIVDLFYVYSCGRAALPAADGNAARLMADLSVLLPALCEWAETDTEALGVRIKEMRPEPDGASGIFPAADGNRRITVRLVTDFEALPKTAATDDLYRAFREAVRLGERVLFLVTNGGEGDGEGRVRAMLTYAPATCRKTAGVIQSMERAGIRVAAFSRTASDENLRLYAEAGLTGTCPADAAALGRLPVARRLDEGCRAFEGCSEEYIRAAVDALRAEGRTVAVLSVDAQDMALLNAADLALTCMPASFAATEADNPYMDMFSAWLVTGTAPLDGPDGLPDGLMATDLCRRRADVLVRRVSATGGGVIGVRRALLAADHVKATVDRTFRYLLLSQTVRTVITALALCLGLTPLPAAALLLAGLLVDTVVTVALTRLPTAEAPTPRGVGPTVPENLLRENLRRIIIAAVSAAVPCLTAAICRFCGMDFGADPAYFALLCQYVLPFVIFRFGVVRGARRDRTSFFVGFGLILCYVAAVAVALGAGLALLWSLVLPLVSPILYMALTAVFDRPSGK